MPSGNRVSKKSMHNRKAGSETATGFSFTSSVWNSTQPTT
jgi:hypothetical protein